MKLMIIRHGDPDYSIDSLTATGWEEAELLAERLCKLNIKAFYCSPMGRACDTAKPTLRKLGREVRVCTWLREFAPLVVRPHSQKPSVAWDWLPKDWITDSRCYDRDQWFSLPPFVQAGVPEETEWVVRGLDTLLAEHGYLRDGAYYRAEQPNEDIVVFFCHFGVAGILLGHLLGISPMLIWHGMSAAPSSVTVLTTEERIPGQAVFRMNCFGDTSHLYVADRTPSVAGRFRETPQSTNPDRV